MPKGLVFGVVIAVPFGFVLWRVPDNLYPWVIAWLFAGLPVLLIGAGIIRRQIDHEDKELDIFGASEEGRAKYLRMRHRHSRATAGKGRPSWTLEIVETGGGVSNFREV